jgi:hypothetical protein
VPVHALAELVRQFRDVDIRAIDERAALGGADGTDDAGGDESPGESKV